MKPRLALRRRTLLECALHVSISSTSIPITLRRIAARVARVRTLLGAGQLWRDADGEGPWSRIELIWQNAPRAIGKCVCVPIPALGVHTAAGWLGLEDATLIELGSGIALDKNWPADVFKGAARLACACMHRQLVDALSGCIEIAVAPSRCSSCTPRVGTMLAHCEVNKEPVAGEGGDGAQACEFSQMQVEDGSGGAPSEDEVLISVLLRLQSAHGDDHHVVALSGAPDTFTRLLSSDRWRRRECDRSPEWCDRLACRADVVVADVRIRTADLEELDSGDVIVVGPSPGADSKGQPVLAQVRLGSALVDLAANEGDSNVLVWQSWKISNMTSTKEGSLMGRRQRDSEGAGATSDSGAGFPIDSVDIAVQFIAGRVEIALGDLKMMEPGSLIRLDAPARAQVDIVANGLRIGLGEMVEIEGQLAIEVVEMGRLE